MPGEYGFLLRFVGTDVSERNLLRRYSMEEIQENERINNTRNFEKHNQLYVYIRENESRIQELKMEISRMEQELWR